MKQNTFELAGIITVIKAKVNKPISFWIYTGYLFEELLEWAKEESYLAYLLENIDVLVDGPFIQEKADKTLAFRGSSNQRIIDMRASLAAGKVILYEV